MRTPPKGLADRIRAAITYWPCELLFVHRDAETVDLHDRRAEIQNALAEFGPGLAPALCVVPVRMLEAWFLNDESAIREAAGNPNGDNPLGLPQLDRIESIPDPKNVLHEVLREASGLSGRRRRGFKVGPAIHRMARIANSFNHLRVLPAFDHLEREVRETVVAQRWDLE